MSGKHEQACGDQFVALSGDTGEPPAGDYPGAFGADVVAALGDLAEMIN
jgi:hypothetical protein